MSKRPAYQWYPGDFKRDTAVQACSFEARSLWREMLDLMHDGEPYGHLTAGGVAIDAGQLARIVGIPPRRTATLLGELEARSVFSRTNPGGVIYSRRMVRDEQKRLSRAAGGVKSLENANVPRPKDGRKDTIEPPSRPSPALAVAVAVAPKTSATERANEDEKTEAPKIVGAIVPDYSAYAIGLATATNKGNTDRWGEQPLVVLWSHPTTVEIATELMGLGVPLELARSTIAAVVRKANVAGPFRGVRYFRNPILEAHAAEKQREHDRTAKSPEDPTGAKAESIAHAERQRESARLRTEYENAEKAARAAWRSNPANVAEVRKIQGEADQRFGHVAHTFTGRGDRLTFLTDAERLAVAFPPFEEWLAARQTAGAPAATG